MRRAAKVDYTQKSVVDALRKIGVQVEVIGKPVDLLCAVMRPGATVARTFLVEVKNRDGKNQLTKDQVEFIGYWPGEVFIVHNAEEAVNAVLGIQEV